MARSRSSNSRSRTRSHYSNANSLSLLSRPSFVSVPLTLYQDRRSYYPSRFTQPAFSLPRSASRLVVGTPNVNKAKSKSLPSKVEFADPNRVLICLRRKIRKEVIHAKGVAGSKNLKKPKRNQFSDIGC